MTEPSPPATADLLFPQCQRCGAEWAFMSDHHVFMEWDGGAKALHLCSDCYRERRDAAKAVASCGTMRAKR